MLIECNYLDMMQYSG